MRRRGTLLLDLRRDINSIWSGIKKRRREEIRRAERLGVEIDLNPNRGKRFEWLDLFKELRRDMGAPFNEPRLRKLIGLEGSGGILVTASIDDRVLSGELYHCPEARAGGGRGLSMIHAATDKHPDRRILAGKAHALLIWEALKWAKQTGLVEYDFGGWNCFREDMKGINSFKESFGGNIWWYVTNERIRAEQTEAELKATVRLEDVILWFDDGHVSVYEHALKIFKNMAFKPIVALVTGDVGRNLTAAKDEYPIMNLQQLLELIDAGWEIASHGVTHSYFPYLTVEEARLELEESKTWISDNLGVTPTKFAPPYNAITPEQLEVALEYYDYVRPIIPPRPPQIGGIHAIIHRIPHGPPIDNAMPIDLGFRNFLCGIFGWSGVETINFPEEQPLHPERLNFSTYSTQAAVSTYSGMRKLQDAEKLIFEEFLTEPLLVMDLGCGTGRVTRHLKSVGHEVIGIDLSPQMVMTARKLHPGIEFRVGDAVNLKAADASFDCVFFSFNDIDLIYPEERRLKCLKEIKRILKPGGLFIHSSHNMEWLENNEEACEPYEGPYQRHDGPYGTTICYFTTPSQQREQLEAAGYTLLKVYGDAESPWIYYVSRSN